MTEQEKTNLLAETLCRIGWTIAIEDAPDDAELRGMLIGNSDYVHELIGKMPEGRNFTILAKDAPEEQI